MLEYFPQLSFGGIGAIRDDEGRVGRVSCPICDLERQWAALGGWSGDVEGVACHQGEEAQKGRQSHS